MWPGRETEKERTHHQIDDHNNNSCGYCQSMNGNNPLFNGSMMRLKEQQQHKTWEKGGIESGQSSPVEIFFMFARKRISSPYSQPGHPDDIHIQPAEAEPYLYCIVALEVEAREFIGYYRGKQRKVKVKKMKRVFSSFVVANTIFISELHNSNIKFIINSPRTVL